MTFSQKNLQIKQYLTYIIFGITGVQCISVKPFDLVESHWFAKLSSNLQVHWVCGIANYHTAIDLMWQMSLIELPGKGDRNYICKSEINLKETVFFFFFSYFHSNISINTKAKTLKVSACYRSIPEKICNSPNKIWLEIILQISCIIFSPLLIYLFYPLPWFYNLFTTIQHTYLTGTVHEMG